MLTMERKYSTTILIALSIFCLNSHALSQGFNITSIQPSSHAMIPANKLEIIVSFSRPIDPASVDNRSFSVFGRWTGVCPGTVLFENNNHQIRFLPEKDFSAGEWITVSLSKNIQSSSSENLSKGYAWNFWTSAESGSFKFARIGVLNVREENEGMIRTYGAYAGDLNGDGYHDFTVPNEDADDVRVFLNDGSGGYSNFIAYHLPEGSKPSTNEGADFNGDGLLDFASGNILGNSVSVFLGNGSGALAPPTTYPVGKGTRGLCVLDLNGDGAQDIVTANREGGNISILLNNSDGTFSQSTQMNTSAAGETTCAAADANEDGILDVFVGSFNSGEIMVLLGDGSGNLSEFSKTDAKGSVWMIATGDIDNDGHVDVVSANSQEHQFALLRGDGNGSLSSAETYDVGRFPLAIDLGDLDADGDLDVVSSNFSSADWTIYENDGTGKFVSRRALQASGAGSCAVLHDRDRDGDLDITGIDELDDVIFLFENTGSATSVDLKPSPFNPGDFQLHQSYPNPFIINKKVKSITFPFSLIQPAKIRLELFNVRGQRVALIVEADFQRGNHIVKFIPKKLPPGMYFYRLSSSKAQITRKLLFLP